MTRGRQARIVLIRHGRSALRRHDEWVDVAGIQRWRAAYDEAGIAFDDAPSPDLIEQGARADVVIASDLPRAIRSAELIAPGRDIVVSPLLREADLEIPSWIPLRWPLGVWAAAIHLQWSYRILRGTDASAEAIERASTAVEWLIGLARGGSTVAVVTHGVFRRLVARRLIAAGWQAGPGRWSYRNWSMWELRRPSGAT